MKRIITSPLLPATILFLGWAALAWRFTVDDAYITFRYADNLAHGLGPVYNVGERVEGYTSFSWMLLMALARFLDLDPVLAAKIVGLLCGAMILAITYRLAAFLHYPRLTGWIAVLGLAVHADLAINAVMGLETLLYTLLLAAAVLSRYHEEAKGGWWLSTLFFALAALTRPEGWGVFGLTWLYQALFVREGWRPLLARLLLFGFITGSHLLWRWSYYGDLLPATYYAKTGEMGLQLRTGLRYLVQLLVSPGLVLLLGFLLAAFQRNRSLRYLLWLCAGYTGLIVWEGGDWMPGIRFLVPIFPFLYLILGQVMAVGYHRFWQAEDSLKRRVVRLGIVGLVALDLALAASWAAINLSNAHVRAKGYEQAHLPLATWLRAHSSPGDSVALMDIGIVGYYSQRRIIDLSGLTDSYIAHAPGGFLLKRYDPAYVLDQKPHYIILVDTDGDRVPDFPIDRRIYQAAEFQTGYRFLFQLNHTGTGEGRGYYLLVFGRGEKVCGPSSPI